jgi:hypothetical protein
MASITPASILVALLLTGMLGMVGQGIRVIAGLKKMNDDATKQNASSADLFIAARLVVSLLIGFVAGVAAGIGLGLTKVTSLDGNSVDVLLGIMAAGYAGTDFVEAFLPTIAKRSPVPAAPDAVMPRVAAGLREAAAVRPVQLLPPAAAFNAKYGVTFCSLVPGGFYSGDPDDLRVHRSVRTNNPGALNFTSWQKTRAGYVGVTQPDDSPDHNVTTIYRSPEYGVAAWYHLLAVRYGFPNGMFTTRDLAVRYAGGAGNAAAVQSYIDGWNRWMHPPPEATAQISVKDQSAMQSLGKAMFSHEAGAATPLHDEQIAFGIEREIAGTLTA